MQNCNIRLRKTFKSLIYPSLVGLYRSSNPIHYLQTHWSWNENYCTYEYINPDVSFYFTLYAKVNIKRRIAEQITFKISVLYFIVSNDTPQPEKLDIKVHICIRSTVHKFSFKRIFFWSCFDRQRTYGQNVKEILRGK